MILLPWPLSGPGLSACLSTLLTGCLVMSLELMFRLSEEHRGEVCVSISQFRAFCKACSSQDPSVPRVPELHSVARSGSPASLLCVGGTLGQPGCLESAPPTQKPLSEAGGWLSSWSTPAALAREPRFYSQRPHGGSQLQCGDDPSSRGSDGLFQPSKAPAARAVNVGIRCQTFTGINIFN